MEKIVTYNTRFLDFLPFIDCLQEGEEERLMHEAEVARYGNDGFWAMTLEQFAKAADGDKSEVLNGADWQTATVQDYYLAKAFATFASSFANMVQAMTVKPSAREEAAATSCKKVTFLEGALFFAREYFGLPNFTAAAQITLADYLLAKKDAFNRTIYQRTLADMQAAELKRTKR